MKATVWTELDKLKGEDGEAVTPMGKPERFTVTVPENPFCGVSVKVVCALVLADREIKDGLAEIEKPDGGGGEELLPPPQPMEEAIRK